MGGLKLDTLDGFGSGFLCKNEKNPLFSGATLDAFPLSE